MRHPDLVWTVAVGFCTQRPIVSDQRTHFVRCMAPDDIAARLLAHSMVFSHKGVVAITRLTIIDCIA